MALPLQTSMRPDRLDKLTISDPRVARIFSNEATLQLLLQFANKERTVSEVARRTKLPVGRVHYHTSTFLRLGLIQLERTEARSGRPRQYYRTTARCFLVKPSAIEKPCTKGLYEELQSNLADVMIDPSFEGVVFEADEGDGIRMRGQSSAERPRDPATEVWSTPRLSEDRAKQFALELAELFEKFSHSDDNGREYLVHAAMAPRSIRTIG